MQDSGDHFDMLRVAFEWLSVYLDRLVVFSILLVFCCLITSYVRQVLVALSNDYKVLSRCCVQSEDLEDRFKLHRLWGNTSVPCCVTQATASQQYATWSSHSEGGYGIDQLQFAAPYDTSISCNTVIFILT